MTHVLRLVVENLRRCFAKRPQSIGCPRIAAVGLALLTLGLLRTEGQPQGNSLATNIANAPSTNFTIASAGANSQVWRRQAPISTNAQGQVSYRINSYVQIATGLNHLVGTNWLASAETISITQTGGVATNGQHQVGFGANLNTSNAVEIVGSDGTDLKTHIMGLSYYDSASGSNVLIAELKDSQGFLVGSNRVVYSNAFTTFGVDVRYTYRRFGFEQDLVLKEQPPAPETFGLPSTTTRLQVWTEFLNPPSPRLTTNQSSDVTVDFGAMKMGHGRAFMVGSPSNSVAVHKRWLTIQGRTFLVEEVPLTSVSSKLQTLPVPADGSTNTNGLQQSRFRQLPADLPPMPKLARQDGKTIQMAVQSAAKESGLVMDYVLLDTDQTDFTFQGDTTYYVSGLVNIDNATFEGGTVIKFADADSLPDSPEGPYGCGLYVGNVICDTGPYQMAMLTSVDDNSVGEAIGSGSPVTASANCYIESAADVTTLSYLRFAYAYVGTFMDSGDTVVWDCQFVNCASAAATFNGDGNLYSDFHNVLFGGCGATINLNGAPSVITLEQVTSDSDLLVNIYEGETVYATNCILTQLSSGIGAWLVNDVDNVWNPGGGTFLSAGAGNYYLATNSTYRDAGTTNISPAMLAELQRKTTYPPVLPASFSSDDIPLNTTNKTEYPTALRDTNTPDLGYHYDPIDYLTTPWFSNATVTLTNGVVIGYWRNLAFVLDNGSDVVSQGGPTQPNVIAYYTLVQEQPANLSGYSGFPGSVNIFDSYHSDMGRSPSLNLRFTHIYVPQTALSLSPLNGSYQLSSLTLHDDELYGAGSSLPMYFPSGKVFDVENNLFQYLQFAADGSGQFSAYNNLHRGGSSYSFTITDDGGSIVTNRDNAFDATSVNLIGTRGYNAFLNGAITNSSHYTGDIVTNLTWQTSWLGNFYQPTNSPLIGAGSRSAPTAGLYHYTVQTNQTVEGNAANVAMGYHYIAVDGYGNPLDTDGDGIPDYLEDVNGNGIVDPGERDWLTRDQGLTGPSIIVYTPLKQ